MAERLYKVLDAEGRSTIQETPWYLPDGDRPGVWMPKLRGELAACERGYHLCRPQDLIYWLGPAIYEAEADGNERITVNGSDSKVVVRRARLLRRVEAWNDRTARLFAADCAEHVLPIFERERPNDKRPREALEVVRRLANGEATADQLTAARAAAWAAAVGAAVDAARAAAWATTRDAAWTAAVDAARAAAWAAAVGAAVDAARAAAVDAERSWQSARLLEYLHGRADLHEALGA